MFTLNAIGYTVLAVLLVLPAPVSAIRWLVRMALLAFTVATLIGWLLFGARFGLAYLDKAIELALVGLLAVELWRVDGGPVGVVHKARDLIRSLLPAGQVG
jgi:hypothetical protein